MRRVVLIGVLAVAVAPAASAKLPLHRCFVGGATGLCGKLVVRENRAYVGGPKIALRVMVLRATGRPRYADPFVYLAGGPGGAATDFAASARVTFAAVNEHRDVLLVDQRGTGGSHALACPKPQGALTTTDAVEAWMQACFRGLHNDPAQYGTVAAMDDLEAVRKALGYPRLNLYGVSYGATAAQVFLRRYPRSVRSVVADGMTLVDVPIFERLGTNGQRALDVIARRCAADTRCARAFPTWKTDLSRLLVRLYEEPRTVDVAGERVRLDAAAAAGVIQSLTQTAEDAAQIPYVVAHAVRGDYQPLARQALRPSPVRDLPNAVMPYSVVCSEPWAVRDPARAAADARGTYLAWAVPVWTARQAVVCSFFPRRSERPADWTRVRSNVPLLAVVGGADPHDPLANIAGLRAAMPRSRVVVVPGGGHTNGHIGCMPDLLARFVARGSAAGLDVSCARRLSLPSFVT